MRQLDGEAKKVSKNILTNLMEGSLKEATTDVNEIYDEYKEAYHKDLNLNDVPCVIARDKMMSGWGGAEGKTHYQVVLCGNRDEAENIEYSMYGVARREQLANVRFSIGVKLPRNASVSYCVGRYAPAWNTLSDDWYKRNIDGLNESSLKEARSHKEDNERVAPRIIKNALGNDVKTRRMVDVSNPKVGNNSYYNTMGFANQYAGTTESEYASKRNKTGKKNEFGYDVYLADFDDMHTPVDRYQHHKEQGKLLKPDLEKYREKEKRARNEYNKEYWRGIADNIQRNIDDNNKEAKEVIDKEKEKLANKKEPSFKENYTKIKESLDIYGISENNLIDVENKLSRYVKRNNINYPVERVKIRTNKGAEDYVGVIVDVNGTKYVISPNVMYAGVYLSDRPMRKCNWVITHLDSGVCASSQEYSSLEDAINDVERVDNFLQNGEFKDELVTRTKEMQDILGNKKTGAKTK